MFTKRLILVLGLPLLLATSPVWPQQAAPTPTTESPEAAGQAVVASPDSAETAAKVEQKSSGTGAEAAQPANDPRVAESAQRIDSVAEAASDPSVAEESTLLEAEAQATSEAPVAASAAAVTASTDNSTPAAPDKAAQAPGELAAAVNDGAVVDPSMALEPPNTDGEPVVGEPVATTFGVLDRTRLDAFLDGFVEAAMLEQNLPGVVVSVVEADQLVSSRGWGYADREKRVLASPSSSLFRVASISKLFTATALMQLSEQGQLDLQLPIGRYLDPPPFVDAEAVTLKHLLTHQAGFEDSYLGHFFADDAASDHTLHDYLRNYAPARVRSAGELSSYSNYSIAVLGEVIATVSGSSFEDYMDQRLLAPLGMRNSTFREISGVPRDDAMPAELAQHRAQGYRFSGGRQQANGAMWLHRGMAPAGALNATAEDMARFMRMHLNDGKIDGVQLLRAETLSEMHKEQTRHHPAVGGNAHGFWANQISGMPTLEHGGALFNFYSNLVLLPEAGIGIFVSTNGAEGRQFTQDLPRLLIEQFVASRPPAPPASTDLVERANAWSGVYRTTRRNYSTMEAAGNLFEGDVTVSVTEPDLLLLSGSNGVTAYRESAAGVFAAERDGRTIAFSDGSAGPAQRLYPNYGHTVLERVPWYARTELFWGVAGALLALSLLRVLGLRLRRAAPAGVASHIAAVLGWLAALAWLLFAAGLWRVFTAAEAPDSPALAHFPDQLTVWVVGIGLACAALSVLCLALTPAVMSGQWPWWRRAHFTLFSLTAVLILPLLWYWRLLGYHVYGTTSVLLPPLLGGG